MHRNKPLSAVSITTASVSQLRGVQPHSSWNTKRREKNLSCLFSIWCERNVWLLPSQSTISRAICKESSMVINLPGATCTHSLHVNVPWQSFPFPFSKRRVKVYKLQFLRSPAHRTRDMTYALHCFKLQIWSLWGHSRLALGSHPLLPPKSSPSLLGRMLDTGANHQQNISQHKYFSWMRKQHKQEWHQASQSENKPLLAETDVFFWVSLSSWKKTKNTNYLDMLSLKIRFKGASWHTDWHHGSAGTHFTYRVPTCLLQPSHPLGFLTPLSPLLLHMVFRKAVYLHFLVLGMLHFFSKSRFFFYLFIFFPSSAFQGGI